MSKVAQTASSSATTVDLEDDRKIDATEKNAGSASNSDMLQPGRQIRPMISCKVAVELVERLYGLQVLNVRELNSYDDRNFLVKIDPQSIRNSFVEDIWPHGYVLKVLNSMDSRKNHIDAEHAIQRILGTKGFNCPQPILNIKGQDKSIEDIVYDLPIESDEKKSTAEFQESGAILHGRHVVRLLTFVPGRLLVEVTYTPQLLRCLGHNLCSMQSALEGFSHPALEQHQSIWSMDSVPQLLGFTSAIGDHEKRKLIEDIVEAFIQEVVPKKNRFQKGVIHGDFNEQNILVRKVILSESEDFSAPSQPRPQNASGDQDEHEVCGILDFGDTAFSFYLYDVAILIMYAMLDSRVVDFFDVGGYILAGYMSVEGRTLNEAEFEALKVCVASRYAQSLTMGAYTYSLNPTNEYLLTSSKNGWTQLNTFWTTPKDQLYDRWRIIIDANRQ